MSMSSTDDKFHKAKQGCGIHLSRLSSFQLCDVFSHFAKKHVYDTPVKSCYSLAFWFQNKQQLQDNFGFKMRYDGIVDGIPFGS